MSAVTALTAQNTTGVSAISEVSPEFLKNQLDMIFGDIYPDAVKIGMVSSAELIAAIAERLTFHKAKNIVVDPVMAPPLQSLPAIDNAVFIKILLFQRIIFLKRRKVVPPIHRCFLEYAKILKKLSEETVSK